MQEAWWDAGLPGGGGCHEFLVIEEVRRAWCAHVVVEVERLATAGDDGSGESHFTVVIEAAAFADQSRLERQRMVNRALGDIPGERVHALAIQASAPTS